MSLWSVVSCMWTVSVSDSGQCDDTEEFTDHEHSSHEMDVCSDGVATVLLNKQ